MSRQLLSFGQFAPERLNSADNVLQVKNKEQASEREKMNESMSLLMIDLGYIQLKSHINNSHG